MQSINEAGLLGRWARECLSRWTWVDSAAFWVVAIFGVASFVTLLAAPHFLMPAEDAVILFQYSRNLAHTGAITYITNGPHAEGATDFGWMLLIAGGIKLHIPPFWTVALCNVASLLLITWQLLRMAGLRFYSTAALFIIGAYGLMPQFVASLFGFSVLPFAFLLVMMVAYFLRRSDVALAITCLLLCLFRPDGVIFAVPMLISALVVYDERLRRAAIFAGAFLVPGLVYFVWRWHYFNCLLPLPFLVKSNVQRMAHLIVPDSVQQGALLCVFVFVLVGVVLRESGPHPGSTRAIVLCLMLLPNLFYFAMHLEQNTGRRFFIYLPVSLAILIAMQWERVCRKRAFLLRLGVALWFVLICRLWFTSLEGGWGAQFDNREAIAIDLGRVGVGTLVVTEAGILPYYSNWTTYDAWGLNTERFTRHLFQPSDVATIRPDAIMMYTGTAQPACTKGEGWKTPYTEHGWSNMTRNIVAGADPSEYDLWYLPFGNSRLRSMAGLKPWQDGQECWFVRRSSPLATDIMSTLSRHDGLPAKRYQALQGTARVGPALQVPTAKAEGHPGILRFIVGRTYRLWRALSD